MNPNLKNQKPRLAVIGSHSALEVAYGAKKFGFENLVITQRGRGETYSKYFRSQNGLGIVDETLQLENFADVAKSNIVKKINSKKTIFIPNRSFETYLKYDYKTIETKFKVPMFGNRFLLSIEERDRKPNQYDLLDKATIEKPKIFKDPSKIDRLVLIKSMYQSDHGLERLFFFATSYDDFKQKTEELIKNKKLTKQNLEKSTIEEHLAGVQVNFNFFYSPTSKHLELLGTDTRRQTNLEGIIRLPAEIQNQAISNLGLQFEEAGHIAVTVLESFLEHAFALGEKFVKASKKFHPKGILGPFALQSMIVPGTPRIKIIVFDVSPRIPGSPGIAATPYSRYLFGKPMTMGERIAKEIDDAYQSNNLDLITT